MSETCTAANTPTTTTTSPTTTSSTTMGTSVMEQPSGNQAALDAAGLTRDPAAEDPGLADAMIASMLQALPMDQALCSALDRPDDSACQLYLRDTPLATAMATSPDAVLSSLDTVFPTGRGYGIETKALAGEGLALGGDMSASVKRTGNTAAVDVAGAVIAEAGAGIDEEKKAGNSLFGAVGKITAEANAGAAQSLKAGWDLPLDGGTLPELVGATAADLAELDLAGLCAHVTELLEKVALVAAPDRLSVDFAMSAGIEKELSGGLTVAGEEGKVGASASATVQGGTSAGYDARGVYGQSTVGASGAVTPTFAPFDFLEEQLGMSINEIQVALGGSLSLRVNGAMGTAEEQAPGGGTSSPSVSYEVILTHDGGTKKDGREGSGGTMKTTDRTTFTEATQLLSWVTTRMSDAEEAATFAADWDAPGGIPAASLPDVGFERSFTFTPGSTEGLEHVLPGWVETLAGMLDKVGFIESISSTTIDGKVTVPVEAVRALVGAGGLPVADGDVEAAVVGVERRLAEAALAAEAAGQTALVVDGRDVSAAAPLIQVSRMTLTAEVILRAGIDLEATAGAKAQVEAKADAKVSQEVTLKDRTQGELLKQLSAA